MFRKFSIASRPLIRTTRFISRSSTPSLPAFRPHAIQSTAFGTSTIRKSAVPLRYVWYICTIGGGVVTGLFANALVASRFNPPIAGSQEDEIALEELARVWDSLDVVKSLRAQGYHLHADTPLDATSKGQRGWMELDIRKNIVESRTVGESNNAIQKLTQETLTGYRGLGIQRAFWNSETRELVAVVWIGPMLSGWPGVAHGGAIATMFQDAMSRMIAGPNVPIDTIPSPSSISVDYLRPTMSSNTFILRASFTKPDQSQNEPPPEPMPKSWLPSWKDFTKKKTSSLLESTIEINGTLEDLDGKVKVRAKGAWPASAVRQ
ncbi:hypothetical protein B0J11DRAFT_102663 [Dendryphion nanum]|uniref:Thioesterase domain-containing protein n=1 Tax=Dendryphion nanum TaxID=256645 RepID=A0A9P9DD69_9PLEO|nr:hypothetical protein B0J11DRAFT_102663 [Dendryphion nanum]